MKLPSNLRRSGLHLGVMVSLAGLTSGLPQIAAAATEFATRSARFVASLDTEEQTFSRFIIAYHNPNEALRSRRIASDLTRVSTLSGVDLRPVRWLATGGLLLRSSRAIDRTQAQRLMQEFAAIDALDYAQPDYVYHIAANDPEIPAQWHLSAVVPNTTYPGANGWSMQAGADVIAGWDVSTGDGIVIAVIDGGYTNHPELASNLAPVVPFTNSVGFDFVYGDLDVNDSVTGWDCDAHDPGNWDPADPADNPSIWHGTHVMGLAAAVYNNGQYGAGVAPHARLLPVRALGLNGRGYESDVDDAIIWASGANADYPAPAPGDPVPPTSWICNGVTYPAPAPQDHTPARVLNLSLGASHTCAGTSMQKAITAAHDAGSIVVVAAGNSNVNVSGVTPASCTNVIVVAATDFGGRRAGIDAMPYSNYGVGVTLAAPGGGTGAYLDPPKPPSYFDVPVMSDWNTGLTVPGSPSFYGIDGTSMAAPLVSGLVADMVSIKPWLTADQVTTYLTANVHPWGVGGIPNPSPSFPIGAGLMDAAATLNAVAALPNPAQATMTATPNPVVVPAGQSGGYFTWSWDAPNYPLVDVYISTNNGPWVYDWVWPGSYHPTTQNYVLINFPVTWKLTPHGDALHVLASVTVSAHH